MAICSLPHRTSRGVRWALLGLPAVWAGLLLALVGCSGGGAPSGPPVSFADDDGPSQAVAPPVDAPPAAAPDAAVGLSRQLAGLAAVAAAQSETLARPALEQAVRGAAALDLADQQATSAAKGIHHWELQFPKGNTIESYARQLDFFGIELGALMPDNKILYASGLSKAKPDVRTGPLEAEKRYYLSWKRGDLAGADHQLFKLAGVDTTGRAVVQFLPPEIEEGLVDLEKSGAGDRADKVQWTRFGLRQRRTGFEFIVLEQGFN